MVINQGSGRMRQKAVVASFSVEFQQRPGGTEENPPDIKSYRKFLFTQLANIDVVTLQNTIALTLHVLYTFLIS
jgi:hypothetical protein